MSLTKILLSEVLLVSTVTIARPCGDHFEFVVKVFWVLETFFAETASSCELAGEAAIICIREEIHLSPGSLIRQIGPLFSYRGYSKPLNVFPMIYFYSYEKSFVVDVVRN